MTERLHPTEFVNTHTHPRWTNISLFGSILWGLCACSAPTQEGFTEQGNYYIAFETTPSPVEFREYFDVTVGVYETANKKELLTSVDILVDSTMPAHQHGMNETPTHSINEDGYTVASGLQWFMTGTWQMEFYITPQDGSPTETAFFELECCEQ